MIWVKEKDVFQILWPSHHILTLRVCALHAQFYINIQFVRLRTITYNLLEKSLKTFIGLLMYLVSRSELLLWICSNQYLTFFSRTYYSLTINFQLVFFQARFSTLHSSLLERHSIFILGPKLLGSHNWIPITLRFQQSIHKFSIASEARKFMNFRLSRKLEDSWNFYCFRS